MKATNKLIENTQLIRQITGEEILYGNFPETKEMPDAEETIFAKETKILR